MSGLFQGTVDFDPGEGVQELTAVGTRDMYLLRLGCAEECAQLRKHRAKGGAGQVKSKVVTDAALGRVTVECTGPSGPHWRRGDLDDRGCGKVRLKGLATGGVRVRRDEAGRRRRRAPLRRRVPAAPRDGGVGGGGRDKGTEGPRDRRGRASLAAEART